MMWVEDGKLHSVKVALASYCTGATRGFGYISWPRTTDLLPNIQFETIKGNGDTYSNNDSL